MSTSRVFYGADHESVRIRRKIESCRQCSGGYDNAPSTVIDRCNECILPMTSQPNPSQALSEHQRIMRDVISCPLYEKTYVLDIFCDELSENEVCTPTTLLSCSNPYIIYEYRTYDRISGIEEIADPVRGISSSEITTRRRRIHETTAPPVVRRHAEHFRVRPPPDPRLCRPKRTGPEPGVPIAPTTPCNLGNQRVDYSNPQ
jgi:hypothetical protein